ncbi:uncharacterized protein ACB058_014453 [Synchiropus picturatus]
MGNAEQWSRAGLWNTARPLPYSKELQERLKLQKRESDYISLLRKQMSESQKKEAAQSPQKVRPAPQQPKPTKPVEVESFSSCWKRKKEACRLWSSFTKETPSLPPSKDLEKEKKRLINLMAYGVEDPTGLAF